METKVKSESDIMFEAIHALAEKEWKQKSHGHLSLSLLPKQSEQALQEVKNAFILDFVNGYTRCLFDLCECLQVSPGDARIKSRFKLK